MGSDRAMLDGFISTLEEFRRLDPEIQAQTIMTFLLAAKNEGITMRELQDKLGVASASMSRNVAALSKVNRHGKPGHGLLVAYELAEDRRTKTVSLTIRGKRLLQTILRFLGDKR